MKIQLINQAGIADADFQTITQAVSYFTPLVTKAWNLVDASVVTDAGDWVVYVTEAKRHTGAAGYHKVEGGKVVAYCSPRASGRLFGTYIKPLIIKGKQIHPGLSTPGLVSVICHEIAEMLCDPQIDNYSKPDSQGRAWLIEVGDHCFGNYFNKVFNNQTCIFPDITTPAFYDLKGKAPFTIGNTLSAPFTMSAKGYAYYKDATGKLVKVA